MTDNNTVGFATLLDGASGFTMACFKATDVPAGTPLYAAPVGFVSSEEFERQAHRLNEWADGMCNAMQWLRNVQDGVTTAADAVDGLQKNIDYCRSVK